LTLKDSPFFVKGAQEGLFGICDPADPYAGATVRQGVSATSSYGIASWDVAAAFTYDSPGSWTHYAQSSPPPIQYGRTNYDDACGGGEHNGQGVIVRVTDKHGNVAELEELARFFFDRWNNTATDGILFGTFAFGAGWTSNHPCPQCDHGSTAFATKAGVSAVFTLDKNWPSYTFPAARGGHLGLVMTKGPGHGAVRLYLDGVLKATVDTYSSTWKYRSYVYDFGPLKAGAHTVKLVNVGTAGRPRVDVQGIGLLAGYTDVPVCDPDTCP
jgi:hypothetical protein